MRLVRGSAKSSSGVHETRRFPPLPVSLLEILENSHVFGPCCKVPQVVDRGWMVRWCSFCGDLGPDSLECTRVRLRGSVSKGPSEGMAFPFRTHAQNFRRLGLPMLDGVKYHAGPVALRRC